MSKTKVKQLPQYEICDGIPYAIIWRTSQTGQTERCPFCDCSHKHGTEDGHRIAHCVPVWHRGNQVPPRDEIQASDGTILSRKNGYMVRTMKTKASDSIFQ